MGVRLAEGPVSKMRRALLEDLAARLAARQSPGGAFLSRVSLPWGEAEDRNCFITALVIRELHGVEGLAAVAEARRKALAYLLRGRYPIYRDLFSFYPHRSHPFWMRSALYPDADDTAVINLELARAGLMTTEALAAVAKRHLLRHRATGDFGRYLNRPWHRDGAFLTWLTTAPVDNPIDCCVNTNVIALLAAAGLRAEEGYTAACEMVNGAARQAARVGGDSRRFTPFYPGPGEWRRALRHAVETGAVELAPAAAALEAVVGQREEAGEPAVCCDVTGTVLWRCEALTLARQLRAEALG